MITPPSSLVADCLIWTTSFPVVRSPPNAPSIGLRLTDSNTRGSRDSRMIALGFREDLRVLAVGRVVPRRGLLPLKNIQCLHKRRVGAATLLRSAVKLLWPIRTPKEDGGL